MKKVHYAHQVTCCCVAISWSSVLDPGSRSRMLQQVFPPGPWLTHALKWDFIQSVRTWAMLGGIFQDQKPFLKEKGGGDEVDQQEKWILRIWSRSISLGLLWKNGSNHTPPKTHTYTHTTCKKTSPWFENGWQRPIWLSQTFLVVTTFIKSGSRSLDYTPPPPQLFWKPEM